MNNLAACMPLDFQGPTAIQFTEMPLSTLEQSVWQRFLEIATQFPGHEAISDVNASLTYSQLAERVTALAQYIISAKALYASQNGAASIPCSQHAPIALVLPHTVQAPTALLACLALGTPYVPLDPTFPLQRNRDILCHSLAQIIITDAAHLALCQDIAPKACTIVVLDTLTTPQSKDSFVDVSSADSIAYILYTSGSTGQPKGVYQNQRGVLHDVLQYVNSVHITPNDKLSMVYSYSVIGSVRDIFAALLMGASVHLLPVKALGVSGVLTQIVQKGISILHAVPVLFRQLTQVEAAREYLMGIRLLYLAGDRLDKADALTFQQLFSAAALLYTGIGSTENATLYRQWFISTTTPLNEFKTLPVGRAIPDRTVRIIDEQGVSVPFGEVGEIEVTSRFMAIGYWQDDALTKTCFLPCSHDPLARVFRTGDLGCELDKGMLAFYGRKDSRVKIRGYLITPADIEVIAKACVGVHEAALIVRRNSQGDATSLVLYWQGEDLLTETALRYFLSTQVSLPQMPARCFKLPQLPMLANFKIDRQKLTLIDKLNHAMPSEDVTFSNDTVGRIMRILADVMTQAKVVRTDNLQSLYADSLDVLRIVLALEHEFNLSIVTEQLYTHFSTVETLAAFIDEQCRKLTLQ